MIKDLNDIIISTEYFGTNTRLEGILSRPLNIVFGHNGSGKSTLAESIRQFSAGDSSTLTFNTDIDEEERKRIFVFDENFIRDNIQLADSQGLGTIVMLGEAGDLTHEKESLEAKLVESEKRQQEAALKKEEATTKRAALEREIEKQLKSDDGYAARGRDILGQKNKISVRLEDIFNVNPRGEEATLRKELSEGIQRISQLRGGAKIQWNATSFDAERICGKAAGLLAQKAEKPELSEREAYIVGLMQHSHNYLQLTKGVILEPKARLCPLCHQEITDEHREHLGDAVARIERAIADQTEAFRQELIGFLNECSAPLLDFSPLNGLFQAESKLVEDAAKGIESALDTVRAKIKARIDNIFADPETIDGTTIREASDAYQNAVAGLSKAIQCYNDDLDAIQALKNRLIEVNRELAYLENKNRIDSWRDWSRIEAEEYEKEATAISDKKEFTKELRRLESRLQQTGTALDFINRCLEYIFFSSDRLKLVPVNTGETGGAYGLLSYNHAVRPDKVSTGERNAIALAYYFASTFKGQSVNDRYSKTSLYVIDDPVSSFDRGNRAGIFTFMKEQLYQILTANAQSKILILSHDLHTVDDLVTIQPGLIEPLAMAKQQKDAILSSPYMELSDKRVRFQTANRHNNYRFLMKYLFEYANSPADANPQDEGIGNQLRRLLESYSSFNYAMGLDDMLNSQTVLNDIPVHYRPFFRILAAKLVLNNTSHAEVRIDPLNTFASTYSQTELRELTKYLLLFIYLTNKTHVKCMIGSGCVGTFEQWLQKLPTTPEDENLEIKRQKELNELIERHQNKVFLVEYDPATYCYHCGKCTITSRTDITEKQVKLIDVIENTNSRVNQVYPLFAPKYQIL